MLRRSTPVPETDAPVAGSAAVPVSPTPDVAAPMTHRQVLKVLVGLLSAMFVAMLSSTIVSNALPRIVADLEGTESGFTWVVIATMITMTASTPLWGKLADLFDQKLLIQISLAIFMLGSLAAGFAPTMGTLIGARAFQGLGVGGLTALVQVVIATMVSPRERGRYSGYIGAVFALATVSGPLIGGLIVDTPFLGWRWCFFIGVPIGLVAFIVLTRTLHLTHVRREAKVDYLGAILMAAAVSLLLAWVSLAGHDFDWISKESGLMVGGGILLLAATVFVETRVEDPIVPLRLFADRTTALATVASIMIGLAMFGSTVYLSQYFQIARGLSPTRAGLMSVFMVGGLMISSLVTGQIISRTGVWKRYLVAGGVLTTLGMGLLSFIDAGTPLVLVGLSMSVLGLGMGATMQNLVLAVQNSAPLRDMGAVSSLVAFFRSMGGSVGIAVLGAILGHRVADDVTSGLSELGVPVSDGQARTIPDPSTLEGPVRAVIEGAYADASAHLFLIAVPFLLVALVCILLIKEVPLRTTVHRADEVPTPDAAPDTAPDTASAEPEGAAR